MAKKQPTLEERYEALAKEGSRKPIEVFLKFTLPPPTYKATLTTVKDRVADDKTKGLVKDLCYTSEGLLVTDLYDTLYLIPLINVNYIIEG